MNHILKALEIVKVKKSQIFLAFLVSLALSVLASSIPLVFRYIVDAVSKNHATNLTGQVILIVLAVLIGAGIINGIFSGFDHFFSETLFSNLITTIRQVIYKKLSTLPVEYYEHHKIGETMEKVKSGMDGLANWVVDLTYGLFVPLTTFVIVLGILCLKAPWISLIVLIFLVIYVIEFYITDRRARPWGKKASDHGEENYAILVETFSNIATIRSLSGEQAVYKKFAKENDLAYSNYAKYSSLWGHSIGRRVLFTELVFVVCLILILKGAQSNIYTAGDLVLIILYFRQVISQMYGFSRFITKTGIFDIRVSRLLEVLETKLAFEDSVDAVKLNKINTLEFENVSFKYPNGKVAAIENIDFNLEPGKTIALVGPSGVGKSTITKLLLRFYLPTHGDYRINAKSASTFIQASVRSRIGLVMQDVALFNDTVTENLKTARSNATKQEIRAAAKLAHAEEFINELPDGYSTLVGERGVKLSGGQKQRIAIARAILKNPDLIILDEATSALDSESERLVQDGLKHLLKGRMAIIIAHRLSTVMHADEIVVLQKGRIVECGDHKSLMDSHGLYAKLFEMQSATGKIEL